MVRYSCFGQLFIEKPIPDIPPACSAQSPTAPPQQNPESSLLLTGVPVK